VLGGIGNGPAGTACGGIGNGPAGTAANAVHVEATSSARTKTLNTCIEDVRMVPLSWGAKPQTALLHKINPNGVAVLTQIGDC